jgi:serine/threonine protein phosphatase PrpC
VSRRLRADVTQLSIISGTEQENAGDTGLVEASPVFPPQRGKGNLYVVVQVSGEHSGKESIHRQLVQIISEEYSRVPGGITNGLRRGIRAANRFLHQRNLGALPLWHRVGEVCCAVLRGEDLYVAVAGDARIHVVKRGEVHRFPPPAITGPPGSTPMERQSPPPLGVDEHLAEVGLFHCQIEEGDVIVLASSGLEQVATQEQIGEAAQGGLDELAHTLSSLASHADLSALLIHIGAAERSVAPEEEPLRVRDRVAPAQSRSAHVPDRRRPTSHRPVRSMAGGLVASFLAFCAGILDFFAHVGERIQAFFSWTVSSGLLGRLGRSLRDGLVGLLQGLGVLTKRMLPEPEPAATGLDMTHVQSIRGVVREERGSRLPLVVVFVIITALAAGSIALVVRNHSRETQFSQHMEDAQAVLALARSGENAAAIKEHLVEASGLVEEALLIKPTDSEAIALRDEVLLGLDEVNQVTRLRFSASASLPEPPSEGHRVLLHDGQLYVLDAGAVELRAYLMDDLGGVGEGAGGSVLLGADSAPTGLTLEEVTDLVWAEAESGRETSNLLLLVNGTSILQLDEGQGFSAVSVVDSEIWEDARAIAEYAGYLYVLDAAEDRILKYAPTGNTYDSFPLSYLQGETAVDLENAVDLAIDGYIYVLAGNEILKFSGGLPEGFSITGLEDQGLQAPVAIFTSPETQHLYVGDAGLGRVVQLTKEGAFVRQFLPPREDEGLFQSLKDLWVDEAGGKLVVLTSEGLFVAPLEQPPPTLQ